MASSANNDFVMLYLADEEVGKLNSDIISRRLLSEFCDVCLQQDFYLGVNVTCR